MLRQRGRDGRRTDAEMRRASRITAAVLGVFAGGASIEHGIYEILQGNLRPAGLMINSMGPPCQPESVWHACEPAMTIIPSFLISGIVAATIGAFILVWSIAFIQKKHAGLIVILASILMLLFGGGIFPPLIGIIGGAVGTRVSKLSARSGRWSPSVAKASTDRSAGTVLRFVAGLWPWVLIVLSVWLLGQWLIGYFFNDFLLSSGFFIPGLIVGLLILSAISAIGHDQIYGGPG